MPKQKRFKTKYAGVTYVEGRRADGTAERIYYITYRRNKKLIEEKAGRQFQDDMTPARAAGIRAKRIEGEQASNEEQREQAKEEQAAEESKWTFQKLWDAYKAQHTLKGLAQDESRYNLYLKSGFGGREPSSLVPMDITRIRMALSKGKEPKKPQTIKNILALLRRLVNFGVAGGLCSGTNFTIEVPKKINNLVTEDLTPEQMKRLMEVLDTDHDVQAAHFMKMALFTGMRRGELFKLQWEHVDFERGFIKIVDPKGGIDQKIPLNNPSRTLLENHPRSDGSSFVFPGRNGNQRVEIRRAVTRIKKAAGLPDDFRPLHGLRHTYASMLASSGQVDLYTLQKLLTHKSPEMTQRYAALRDEAMRKASNLAGDIVSSIRQHGKNVVGMPERTGRKS